MARESEPVQQEAARQLSVRDRMSASTSFLAYGLQALVLYGHVADRVLWGWLLLVVASEAANGMLAVRLGRHTGDPVQRRRAVRWLAVALFCSGSSWGLTSLMPGLHGQYQLYMFNVLFLVVVGVISVHNLCLSWPALIAFNVGLMWPLLVAGAVYTMFLPLALVVTVAGEWTMVQIYGRTTRQLFLRSMRAHLATEAMAAQLRQKNEDLTQALAVIAEMADLDPLTQCLNRRALMRHLQEPVRHQRFGACFGIVLLDIDHFKQINDSRGHGVGDQVLVAVADCLRNHLRTQDCLARWGGEEFICLLADADGATVQAMAERLRRALAATAILPPPAELRVTASFGLALCRPGYPLDAVIDQADQAMYRAKHGGRNRVEA
ncbi:GGDEF domain-containing protein [Rhodoferax sp. WC2427]|uniref:GGDEF domain-containing protein n=1 Tax=Rhodoferax sp. WC2427 TaxID=3234144 RepID=UPI003466333E